jgi:O-methyltransferase
MVSMNLIQRVQRYYEINSLKKIQRKFKYFSMIPSGHYVENLLLCSKYKGKKGVYVECGVWKGGMTAGMASMLGNDFEYHLFDSFEGLPPAKDIDGKTAIEWQKDTSAANFYDNCRADEKDAEEAMKLAGAKKFFLHKGWFDETLPKFQTESIDILRIDGDWYDSVMTCLKNLFPKVKEGGIIILDDYYTWDGCTKAVHDYLSEIKSASKIHMYNNSVAYIEKRK